MMIVPGGYHFIGFMVLDIDGMCGVVWIEGIIRSKIFAVDGDHDHLSPFTRKPQSKHLREWNEAQNNAQKFLKFCERRK